MTILKDILSVLEIVTGKRAKTVINHILEKGFITSQEIKELYGYNPPQGQLEILGNMVYQ
jgi:hypothetical protein